MEERDSPGLVKLKGRSPQRTGVIRTGGHCQRRIAPREAEIVKKIIEADKEGNP
jgi:hypothetical protein